MSGRPHWVRLSIWIALTAFLSYATFTAVEASGSASPGEDDLFKWSTAAGAVVGGALLLAVTAAIAFGRSDLLALRRSRISTLRGIGISLLALFATLAAAQITISLGGDPGEEQGLLSDGWHPGRTAPFVANVLALVVLAPLAEELYVRGLGFSLFRSFGRMAAIVMPAIGWSLMHGLPSGIFPLFVFGAGLCYLRERSDSVVPPIVLHAFYNGLVVAFAFAY